MAGSGHRCQVVLILRLRRPIGGIRMRKIAIVCGSLCSSLPLPQPLAGSAGQIQATESTRYNEVRTCRRKNSHD